MWCTITHWYFDIMFISCLTLSGGAEKRCCNLTCHHLMSPVSCRISTHYALDVESNANVNLRVNGRPVVQPLVFSWTNKQTNNQCSYFVVFSSRRTRQPSALWLARPWKRRCCCVTPSSRYSTLSSTTRTWRDGPSPGRWCSSKKAWIPVCLPATSCLALSLPVSLKDSPTMPKRTGLIGSSCGGGAYWWRRFWILALTMWSVTFRGVCGTTSSRWDTHTHTRLGHYSACWNMMSWTGLNGKSLFWPWK